MARNDRSAAVRNGNGHASLVESIYDTVLEPGSWPVVLEYICRTVGASGAFLYTPEEALPEGNSVYVSYGLPRTFQDAVRTEACGVDVWKMQAIRRGISRGTLYTDEMLVPEPELVKTDHYNMHLRPHDVHRVMATALSVKEAGSTPMVALSLYRPRQAEPFARAEVLTYSKIAAHLRRANDMHWRLWQAGLRGRADAAVLERLAIGVALLDSDARLLFANQVAERLMQFSGGEVTIRDGRMVLTGTKLQPHFKALVQSASVTAEGMGFGGGGTLRIGRSKEALTLEITPVNAQSPASPAAWPQARVAVLMSKPMGNSSPFEAIRAAYGLTAAEAQVAGALADGHSLRDVASRLALSKITVRNQAQAVFAKTGARNQAALVRLLAGHPAALGRPEDA